MAPSISKILCFARLTEEEIYPILLCRAVWTEVSAFQMLTRSRQPSGISQIVWRTLPINCVTLQREFR